MLAGTNGLQRSPRGLSPAMPGRASTRFAWLGMAGLSLPGRRCSPVGHANMTEKQLEEIKERCEAATPGPWRLRYRTFLTECGEYENHHSLFTDNDRIICDLRDRNTWYGDGIYDEDSDAEFIAYAREDIPALLEEIEKLKEEIKNLEKEYSWLAFALTHAKIVPHDEGVKHTQRCIHG